MEKEIPLYQHIFNKIANRILIGSYPKGYQLASAQKLNARYGVGYTSIRRAMRLLEEEGFIRQEARRRPTVVFDPEDPDCRRLRWRMFLSHTAAHLDCYRALPCLLPGLVMLGARQCTPRLLKTLDELCAQSESSFSNRYELLELMYIWQLIVTRQAGSALAEDLFLQIRGFDELRFAALPPAGLLPGEAQAALLTLRAWTGLLRRGDLDALYPLLTASCLQACCALERDFRPLTALPEYREVRQVEFRWYLRQTPAPLYQKLAGELLRAACHTGMRAGDCFPAEGALMERYEVAAVTVHSAAAMLNELGIARTVNGVGTRLTGACTPAGMARPYLRDGRESIGILAACSRALARDAAPCLAPQTAVLRRELADCPTHEGAVLRILHRMVGAVPARALEVVFEQLEGRYIFGLYAAGLPGRPGRGRRLQEVKAEAGVCLDLLEQGNADGFSVRFGSLCDSLVRELCPEQDGLPAGA